MPQDIDEAEGVAAVKEAFDLGINFFDTSPYYGDTKSETVRGRGGTVGSGGVGGCVCVGGKEDNRVAMAFAHVSQRCCLSLGAPLVCVCVP